MATRERYHREIFAGGTEEELMEEARKVAARLTSAGWDFDSWWWDSGEYAREFKADTVLVMMMRWVGEQQSQESLDERARGGWNEGTRALPIHEVDRERRIAELEADVVKLRSQVAGLLAWQASLSPVTVITGELAPVSPGPRPWEAR
jgi:hypothetical protein